MSATMICICKNIKPIIIWGEVPSIVLFPNYHKTIMQNIGLHECTVQEWILYYCFPLAQPFLRSSEYIIGHMVLCVIL